MYSSGDYLLEDLELEWENQDIRQKSRRYVHILANLP